MTDYQATVDGQNERDMLDQIPRIEFKIIKKKI